MSETISSGLTLTIPTIGEKNWSSVTTAAFTAISAHDHTGGGNGNQISTGAIAANAVTGAKIATSTIGLTNLTTPARQDLLVTTGGSSNAYTATFSPAISAWSDITGVPFKIIANHTNSGASTINANGVGAVSLIRRGGQALVGNEIIANYVYTVMYDGTNARLMDELVPQPIGPFLTNQSITGGMFLALFAGYGTAADSPTRFVQILGNRQAVALTAATQNALGGSGNLSLELMVNGSGVSKSVSMTTGEASKLALITPHTIASGDTVGMRLSTGASVTVASTTAVGYVWVV